jgi:spore cortex formation protein SpoVR/YcgB (stage V sporulation)
LNIGEFFGYYISFKDKGVYLRDLEFGFKKFFQNETDILGLIRKLRKKRNGISHFLIDKGKEKNERLLMTAISKEDIIKIEKLNRELDNLIKEEHSKMNSLQEKMNKN